MRPKVRGPVRHALPIVCGLMALAPLTSQGAFAQTIPSYTTNAHCQRVAGFGGTFSQSVYGSCLTWSRAPRLLSRTAGPQSRRPCASVATAPPALAGRPPTRSFKNCVDVEVAAPATSGPPAAGGYCEVLSSDVGGRPGNAVQYSLRMPAGPRESDANGDLHQQVARALTAGTNRAKDGRLAALSAARSAKTQSPRRDGRYAEEPIVPLFLESIGDHYEPAASASVRRADST
jgi:hypothetical protein